MICKIRGPAAFGRRPLCLVTVLGYSLFIIDVWFGGQFIGYPYSWECIASPFPLFIVLVSYLIAAAAESSTQEEQKEER